MLPLRYPESWRGTACSLPRTGYLLPPFSSYRLRMMMMMMMMILTIIMCLGTWHIDPATFLDIEGGTDITESGKNDDDLKCDQNVCVLKKSDWMTVYFDNSGEINIEETISLVRIKSRRMHIAYASYNINVMGRVYYRRRLSNSPEEKLLFRFSCMLLPHQKLQSVLSSYVTL